MNCGLSTWDFNINLPNINKDIIDYFLIFSENLTTNFFLDLNKQDYSLIEKIIYDIVLFHSNRLNISLENKSVSFWTKITEYNFDYIHMHTDHCDYESRIFNTQFKKPLFTSLIYLNNNGSPTLLTDVTPDMSSQKNFFPAQ